MKTPNKQEELGEGCGKIFQMYGITKCGETWGVTTLLCEKCQGIQESRTQAISEFKEILKDKKYRYVRRSLIKRLEKTAQEITG